MTTSQQTRGNHGGGNSNGNGGNSNGKFRAPPSRDLRTTALLVLAAEAVATLIADDANGGNGSIAIIGRASLVVGGGVIN